MIPIFWFKLIYTKLGKLPAGIALVLTVGTMAASLTDYRERLEYAHISVEELFEGLGDSSKSNEQEIAAEIEQYIPAREKIGLPGGSIETDNQWLGSQLRAFANETDAGKRGAILTAISERLLSITETVKALEQAATADQTKDQDKQKLAEILARAEYQKPATNEESLFQKWWNAIIDWLAKLLPRPNIMPGAASDFASLQFGLQILIYIIVLAVVGLMLYKFAPFLFRRSGRNRKFDDHDRVILGERMDANSSADSIFAEAESLAREGNLRAAIRKGYIALLWELGNRNAVRLAGHKTNRDYLRDVRNDENLFENLSGLTRNYESSWYGLRTAQQSDWEDFRSRYHHTIAGVKR